MQSFYQKTTQSPAELLENAVLADDIEQLKEEFKNCSPEILNNYSDCNKKRDTLWHIALACRCWKSLSFLLEQAEYINDKENAAGKFLSDYVKIVQKKEKGEISQKICQEILAKIYLGNDIKNKGNSKKYRPEIPIQLLDKPTNYSGIYSAISPQQVITPESWIVAIGRKKHALHVFLVIEGITDEKGSRQFQIGELFMHKYKEGYAYIEYKLFNVVDLRNMPEKLKRKFGENIIYQDCWSLQRKQAEKLIQDVLSDKCADNIRYHILGNTILKSTSEDTYNCFSWACEKLHNLNDQRIKLPEKITDCIAAQTSLYIQGDQEYTSPQCMLI